MATRHAVTMIGLNRLRARLRDFPKATIRAADDTLEPLAKKTVAGIKSRISDAPRVDLAELRDNMHFEREVTRDGVQYIVKPSPTADRYAIFVEENTRPHFPPIQALQGWADRHNIPVYAVAKKIAREGTTGIHMFDKQFESIMGEAQRAANRLGQNIVIELRWGKS